MKRKSSILLTPPKNQTAQAATSDVNLILDQNEFDGIEVNKAFFSLNKNNWLKT